MATVKKISLGGNMSQPSPVKEKLTLTLPITPLTLPITQGEQPNHPENPQNAETSKIAKAALTHRSRRKEKMPPTGDITTDVKEISLPPKMLKRTSQKENASMNLLRIRSGTESTSSDSESERIKRKNFELMPRDFKYQNFVTPELTKLQLSNIMKFENDSAHFIAAVRAPYSTNQLVTDQQIKEINQCRNDMLNSAATIVGLIQAGQSIASGKPKDIRIDFLYDLRQILEKSSFFTKVESYLKSINNDLKDLFIINFKQCRHDNRVKMLIPGLDLEIEKGKNSELEKKQKEIKILHHYREVMLELAKNLERISKNYQLPEYDEVSNVQEKILKQVETFLSKIFKTLKKYDKDENELKRILQRNSYESYKSIVYASISKVIKTQVIEIFWINANKQALMALIQFRSEEFKNVNQRHALFCSDCLEEFNDSLNHQKYDVEFLLGWRRMVGSGSVIYIDKERRVLLEPRRIREPDDSDDLEKMRQYCKEMDDYGKDSMTLLSKCAFFDDEKFLDHFFTNAFQLSQESMTEAPSQDPLEIHARIFSFLESLLRPLPENKKILSHFNKALLSTNKETISRLEQKAKSNGQECSGAEMALRFMLQFYRALNHKYIMEPISNLEELYKLAYSSKESIIKKDVKMLSTIEETDPDKEVLQPARCIYIVLGGANFEVHSVRADEIDPGPGIDETYCYIYTYTSVRRAYPGELASYPHSIEFSYQRVKSQTPKRSSEEIQAIESVINEKIRLLGLLIDAAGFPNFVERYAEST
jgi:hypothetical protein